jgi:diguanylate cyclase (GGDEF)-like protein
VDGLTNLYNHRHFQEALVRTAREHGGGTRPYAVLMMDLDNFKEINDRYGHVAGDAVLRGVGEAILSVTRREDVAARYGGEEFAVILPGLDAARGEAVGDRIRRLVEERTQDVEGLARPLRVTLSVGVSAYPEHGEDHQLLLERADAALYRAKRSGKNRVCGAGRG